MAIDFPNSPTTGDIHTVSGKQWQWDSEKWIAYGSSLAPDVLKVDSGNNRVGINQTSPAYSLDVTGSARITGDLTVSGTTVTVDSASVLIKDRVQFEGATANDYETVLLATDPTADRTITLPDSTGTVALTSTVLPLTGGAMTGAITTNSTFDGVDIATRDAILTSTTTTANAALPKAGGTLSGTIVAADQVISAPVMKDYAETVYAGGNSGTSQTLALTNGNVQTWTMNGNCTFTMPSGSTLQAGSSFTLILTQDGTGSRTGTFTGVKWAGGTAPTLTTTATSGIDILTFTTFNGGAAPVWHGFLAGAAMA
tara:strand:+ start:1973 stop:2908 length:936 start_codon:yes stop_codon:yes gene_type:complete